MPKEISSLLRGHVHTLWHEGNIFTSDHCVSNLVKNPEDLIWHWSRMTVWIKQDRLGCGYNKLLLERTCHYYGEVQNLILNFALRSVSLSLTSVTRRVNRDCQTTALLSKRKTNMELSLVTHCGKSRCGTA